MPSESYHVAMVAPAYQWERNEDGRKGVNTSDYFIIVSH